MESEIKISNTLNLSQRQQIDSISKLIIQSHQLSSNENITITQTSKSQLDLSKEILSKLDDYSILKSPKNEILKEEIGFCCRCNKMIALKFTVCRSCNSNFCKTHREAHQCNSSILTSKAKFLEGKNDFLKKLKINKIKAGVI